MALYLRDLRLTEKDWLLDGMPIRSPEQRRRFAALDWSRACIDLGPSPAGNLGPYWHVPCGMDDDEIVHRLYPKALNGKWGPFMRQACLDYAEWSKKYRGEERHDAL